MDKKSKVISNLIWRFFERFGAQAVSIIVGIILARKLGPGPAGDIAVMEKAKYITADHVKRAKKRSEPVEEQIKQRYGSYQKGMTHDISDAQKQKSEYYLQNEHIDDSMYQ